MFGIFKKQKTDDSMDWDNDVPPTELQFFMEDHKDLTLSEQVEVVMYQMDRIESKIDQLLINRVRDEKRDF